MSAASWSEGLSREDLGPVASETTERGGRGAAKWVSLRMRTHGSRRNGWIIFEEWMKEWMDWCRGLGGLEQTRGLDGL